MKDTYSFDNLCIINSVYKFFVENITNLLLEMQKYLLENNEKNIKPFFLIEFKEAVILTLSSLIEPSSVNIIDMKDSIELSDTFDKEGFNFFSTSTFLQIYQMNDYYDDNDRYYDEEDK